MEIKNEHIQFITDMSNKYTSTRAELKEYKEALTKLHINIKEKTEDLITLRKEEETYLRNIIDTCSSEYIKELDSYLKTKQLL